MHFQYLCLYTYTYIHKQGQGLSSGLQRGPDPRARGAQYGGLCRPTLITEGGWKGESVEAGARQSPSQQLLLPCQAKAGGGHATTTAAQTH